MIALDGPAGSGKSTVAKLVARELQFQYVDSGALYRGLTFSLLTWCKAEGSKEFSDFTFDLHASLKTKAEPISTRFWSLPIELRFSSTGENQIYLQDQLLLEEIRSPDLTRLVRFVADKPLFRDFVNSRLHGLAKIQPLVLDGRDIGTVVFPDAMAKFFLTASSRIRAIRRQKEWLAKGTTVDLDQLEQEIIARDASDESREIAPLRPASDAIPIDTSDMDSEAVVKAILSQLSRSGQI